MFVDETHESVADLENWLSGLAPFERAHQEGEIDDLFEAASRGELQDSDDARTPIKPVRTDPEIYELRRKALTKNLRFYHGEPAELPQDLVALHRHIKSDTSSQQTEIDHATQRYQSGRATRWM